MISQNFQKSFSFPCLVGIVLHSVASFPRAFLAQNFAKARPWFPQKTTKNKKKKKKKNTVPKKKKEPKGK